MLVGEKNCFVAIFALFSLPYLSTRFSSPSKKVIKDHLFMSLHSFIVSKF